MFTVIINYSYAPVSVTKHNADRKFSFINEIEYYGQCQFTYKKHTILLPHILKHIRKLMKRHIDLKT